MYISIHDKIIIRLFEKKKMTQQPKKLWLHWHFSVLWLPQVSTSWIAWKMLWCTWCTIQRPQNKELKWIWYLRLLFRKPWENFHQTRSSSFYSTSLTKSEFKIGKNVDQIFRPNWTSHQVQFFYLFGRSRL
jgi:hypothetical protein